MQEIHSAMLKGIANDEEAKELYEQLSKTATKYANYRIEWLLLDRGKKIEKDDYRTGCHNSLIVKLDVLARYLRMNGKDTGWRETLGYEKDDKYNRKRLGDFACYLAFVNGLNAR
jgi:hypothetical protein